MTVKPTYEQLEKRILAFERAESERDLAELVGEIAATPARRPSSQAANSTAEKKLIPQE